MYRRGVMNNWHEENNYFNKTLAIKSNDSNNKCQK